MVAHIILGKRGAENFQEAVPIPGLGLVRSNFFKCRLAENILSDREVAS